MSSLQRCYVNNFINANRQEGMDLLVGDAEFNSETSIQVDDPSCIFTILVS